MTNIHCAPIRGRVRGTLLLALLLSGSALAQDRETPGPLENDPVRLAALLNTAKLPWEDYASFLQSRQALTAHGPDLFGDNVNLYNGALSFSVTDINLRGNSSLPVELTRTFSVGAYPEGKPMDGAFGDWELDLPRVEGIYGMTWHENRCSQPIPSTAYDGGVAFPASDYWQGLHAQMPGGGELLVADTGTPAPTNGETYRFVTAGLTYVRCIILQPGLNGANTTGEGFEALTTDGTKYTFAHMAQTFETPLSSPPSIGSTGQGMLVRKRNALYVTRIEDRFQNWVTFTYQPGQTPTSPVQLQSIDAKDGRRISVVYSSNDLNGRIVSATAHGRTWNYGYDATTAQNASLNPVTLPLNDAQPLPNTNQWHLSLRGLAMAKIEYSQGDPRHCTSPNFLIGPATVQGTVTHPAGATGTFELNVGVQGRSNVPRICMNWNSVTYRHDDFAKFPLRTEVLRLSRNTVTGPALPLSTSPDAMIWNYSYQAEATWACSKDNELSPTGPSTASCPEAIPDGPVCASDTCAGSATATVQGPGGDWRRYTFGNSFRYDEGLLRKVERGAGPSNIPHIETTTYQLAQSGQPYALPRGRSLRSRADSFISEQPRPRIQHQIARDGATFTWAGSGFDAYARPTTEVRSSSLGGSRTDTTTFRDNTARWVIGQVAQVLNVNRNQVVSSTTFHPTSDLPTHTYSFGQLQGTLGYHPDGTLHTYTDPRSVNQPGNFTTTLTQWKRGIPQHIQFPDNTTQSATVDDLGDIRTVTDQLGGISRYDYDSQGRLTTMTPDDTDEQPWNSTSIVYEKLATGQLGIGDGHWLRTESRGAYRKLTYFDALWRPSIEQEFDSTSASTQTATRRFSAWRYDHRGQPTFAAYPIAAANSMASFVSGTRSEYDALGRLRFVRQDAENNTVLTTEHQYLNGFVHRVINPRLYATQTTFYAWDSPDTAQSKVISAPHGVTTTFSRDTVYGNPLSITRSGTYNDGIVNELQSLTRSFVYDSAQRLCKRIDPESGATVFDYDVAGNLQWSADGLTQPNVSSTTACNRENVPTAQRVMRSYDVMGRLGTVDYPDSTDDLAHV
jgi:YD repeat-containing protein